MDIFGVGAPELVILLLLGIVLLGPKRAVTAARETKKVFSQIQNITKNISKEINREFDFMNYNEKQENKNKTDASDSENLPQNGTGKPKLPEAYERFREDFPDEGELTDQTQVQKTDFSTD